MTPTPAHLAVWAIAILTTVGVIARPFRLPEAVWAAAGAGLLLVAGLLPWADGLEAVGKGLDLYLFLIGMMLLSETARRERLFDWVAGLAVEQARGSARRLFILIYAVGVVVTVFLSNDATAVVLTPAVFAAARKAKVEAGPYLLICAFVANAASFVLPLSNPANLVLYGDHTPALGRWLARFAAPSALSIVATYVALLWVERDKLADRCVRELDRPALSAGGWTALAGLAITAGVLLVVSTIDRPLGLPTCVLGGLTSAFVLARKRESPWETLERVSWAVLPLVAGLFVVVEALDRTGAASALAGALRSGVHASVAATAAGAGGAIALASNLINNLPAGLIAATTIARGHPPQKVVDALLIGVDLGPNLSVTGSLATILWLGALRREGEHIGFWRFLKVGAVIMPPALVLAVGARLLLA